MPQLHDVDYVIIDTETTGKDPATDAVVEVGAVKWRLNVGVLWTWSALVNPGRPIPPAAQAVHGITDAMVAKAPSLDLAMWELTSLLEHGPQVVLVAHNAAFDAAFLAEHFPPKEEWACSYRMARHLWPHFEAHNNQFLRYRLGLTVPALSAHRAAEDALVTAAVWERCLATFHATVAVDAGVSELLAYINAPIQVQKMPFGKYAGQSVAQLPPDYLRWCLTKMTDLDADLRASLEGALRGPDLFSAHA